MTKSFDRVFQLTSTTGTGTVTLGASLSPNVVTFAQAGAVDGDTVNYVIEDGSDYEIGVGTIGGAGLTLARTTVSVSKVGSVVGTAKLTLTGNARVRSAETARYFNNEVFKKGEARLSDLTDIDFTTPPTTGQGLVWNGTDFIPGAAGGGLFKGNLGTTGNRAGDIFRINAKSLTQNVTISSTENASATGPLEVATGFTLEVETGGTLVII